MNQSTNKANNLNEMKEAGKNQSSLRELKINLNSHVLNKQTLSLLLIV